jgi:protein involved in polysaccharide export with SLBB domain
MALILTGAVEAAEQLEVTRSGFVFLRNVGQIYVNNLTLEQFRDVLYERLALVYSGVSRQADAKTHFEVTVANVRMNTIRVIGEVMLPGTYQISAAGGVLAALYEAGGLTEAGNFRTVEVRRGPELVGTVDLYEYLLGGSVPNELTLASGDVVFVPVRGRRVKIAGEVTRPAIYELKVDETLSDLVRLAGGLTPLAAANTATIDRIIPREERTQPGRSRTVLSFDLASILDSAGTELQLVPEDSVTVFPISGPRTNAVTIQGSVWQPGTYELEYGMRLWDLINMAGGLRPQTFGGRAQILRLNSDSSRQMLGAALTEANNPPQADNPILHESDEVTVFARTEFRPTRYVAVFGAVQMPGVFQFADSMTLRDAVLLAGGLTDDAYLVEAEVSRLRETAAEADGDSLALVMRVPLDSSYVFDPTGYVTRPVGPRTTMAVRLQPFDNVFVRRQPGMEIQRNVVITGEVRFPGRYSLVARDERLLNLINRAGGLTPQAYSNGIRFFRSEGFAGRIGVDLPRVLRDPGFRDNLALTSGDSIHIPRYLPTVLVEGAVNSPASVPFRPNANMEYYIDAAGGFHRLADKGGRFVQQPNGLVEKRGRPEPGAAVFVPARDPTDRGFNYIAFLSALTSVLGTISTVLIVALTR